MIWGLGAICSLTRACVWIRQHASVTQQCVAFACKVTFKRDEDGSGDIDAAAARLLGIAGERVRCHRWGAVSPWVASSATGVLATA